jgi:hypothetical protein
MADEYGAPFIFGIGHGDLGDESNDPAKIKDSWTAYKDWFRDGISHYQFNIWGAENMYVNFGEGLWIEVGEFLDAPKTGEVLIQTLGVTGPYYASNGTSLYDRNDTLFKIVEGNKELEIPAKDVMDSDVYLIPSASARYPGEGWQPIGQLDMDE